MEGTVRGEQVRCAMTSGNDGTFKNVAPSARASLGLLRLAGALEQRELAPDVGRRSLLRGGGAGLLRRQQAASSAKRQRAASVQVTIRRDSSPPRAEARDCFFPRSCRVRPADHFSPGDCKSPPLAQTVRIHRLRNSRAFVSLDAARIGRMTHQLFASQTLRLRDV